jgi:hypothetical protein
LILNDLQVTWLMGPGQTNTLQATPGGPGGSHATKTPSRFYRARLVS